MRGHVDAEALAMCREGLLGRRRTARIRAHLSACSSCAEADAGLAEVPSLLALTSAPPMPAEFAARIGAAVAAEAAGRQAEAAQAAEPAPGAHAAAQGAHAAAQGAHAAAQGAQEAKGAAPAVPGVSPGLVPSPASGERTPRRRPVLARRVLAGVAAAALVVAGGGYLLSRMGSSSQTSASSAAAPRTAQGPAAQAGRPNATAGSSAAAGSSGFTVISSGTNYRSGHLTAQAAAVLGRYPRSAGGLSAAAPTGKTPAAQVPATSGTYADLATCVARIIAAGLRPRLIDQARYNGRAATIVVLPASARGPGQVLVIGPGCSASRGDVIARATLPGSS